MKLKNLLKKIIKYRKPDYTISDEYSLIETLRFFNIFSLLRGFIVSFRFVLIPKPNLNLLLSINDNTQRNY